MVQFITCDRLRQSNTGELFWQNIMRNKIEISEKEFLKNVNIRDVLDVDESWNDYKNNARKENDQLKFYKFDNTYFFQRAGFEFIWIKRHYTK